MISTKHYSIINPALVTLAKKRPDMAVVPCANKRPGENLYFQQRFKQL